MSLSLSLPCRTALTLTSSISGFETPKPQSRVTPLYVKDNVEPVDFKITYKSGRIRRKTCQNPSLKLTPRFSQNLNWKNAPEVYSIPSISYPFSNRPMPASMRNWVNCFIAKNLYSNQLAQWRREFAELGVKGLSKSKPEPTTPSKTPEQKRIEQLEKENARLLKQLSVKDNCILLQKKPWH